MNLLKLFIILFISGVADFEKSSKQASYVLVEDGNLIFQAADNKNIQFKTTSTAGVSINNIELIPTLNKAQNVSTLLEIYSRALLSHSDALDFLESRATDVWSKSLKNMSVTNQNSISLYMLRRAYNILRRKVINLENSLMYDDCRENPCKNGGSCQDMFEKYVCRCAEGWQGTDCLEDVDECFQFNGTDLGCQNGATCVNLPGSYRCECQEGYVGTHCLRRKVDCDTGGDDLCGHGDCVPQDTSVGYTCLCHQGWTTNKTHPACVVDVDECNMHHQSCSKDPPVSCTNLQGSFTCDSCPAGYTGNGYYCVDINECEINNGGCSLTPKVMCINTQGSRFCGSCPPGYTGDGVTCVFSGVCQNNNGGCHYLAQCRENPSISSTYPQCTCPTGFVGDGIGPNGCTRTSNPCAPNPCLNGDCSVNPVTGDYVCSCRRTYTGRNCDILRNPCDPSPCMNGGTCQNFVGTRFQCFCANGFRGRVCQNPVYGCGENLSGSTGVLKYPPGYFVVQADRLSCPWTIRTNTSKILNITFTKFDVKNTTGCRSDWLQIHDGPNSAARSLGRFCGSNLPLGGNILTTQNIIYLWLYTTSTFSQTGFELKWNTTDPACGGYLNVISHGSIQSPGSPGNYPPNRDCYWSLHAPMGKRILFHFFSLDIGTNANCDQDYIEFFTIYTSFAKICNSSILTPFYSTNQDVLMHFHSDNKDSHAGFQMTYSVSEGIPGCGGIFTAPEGTIQSKELEDEDSMICEYKIQPGHNYRTKITYVNLDLVRNGCKDYLEVHEGSSRDSPLVERFCDNTLPPSYTSTGDVTIISSISKKASRWKIKYETVCGMKLYNSTGSFESPPISQYKSDCVYQIEQNLGYVIILTLKTAKNESYRSLSCDTNYIEIRDGDHADSPVIKKICESGPDVVEVSSTYNHLWIRYYRSRIYGALPFEATYTSEEKGCGGVLRDRIGNIQSPPRVEWNSYGMLRCSWVIIAPPNSVIQLHWALFKMPNTYKCSIYYMRVFDNSTELGTGGQIGNYCGTKLPETTLSSGNIVTIFLVTNKVYNLEFLVTYHFMPQSTVCGGTHTTPAGILKSPNYPNLYPVNKDCAWIINVQGGQQIQLNVTDFDLENYPDCKFDYLEIRNGGHPTSPLIGKYCGKTISREIISHTNQIYIHFVSDMSNVGKGFKITWSSATTGCGGKLTSPSGSIISPNYPESYPLRISCTWYIRVSAGSHISVVFGDIELNIEYCDREHYMDRLEIFDGSTLTSKLLAYVCNRQDKPIESSANQMMIKFNTFFGRGRGFHLIYATICNNTVTGFRGTIESPNYYGSSRPELNCVWNIIVPQGNKINITFSHFELISSSSCVDYVEVNRIQSDEYGEDVMNNLVKYCGTDSPDQLTINSHYAQIHFVTTREASRFRLEWQLYGCGGHLKGNSGKIQSPNYPHGYPPSTDCQWLVEVDLGYSIRLQFNELDFEKQSCSYDWVKVYNGPDNSSTLILQLCNQRNTSVIHSIGNQMFVEFHSDVNQPGRGFSAEYSTVATKCGGKFTAPEGYIFSPNYPKHFDMKDNCSWFMQLEEGHRVELNFEDLELPINCKVTNIKVYDGSSVASPLLQTVCNDTSLNDTIKSTFNEMLVVFSVGYWYDLTKGFKAQYKRACGSRIMTNDSGSIRVNNAEFADHYSGCTWTIVSSEPTRHITLIIGQMQMSVYYCDFAEPIKIYAGEDTDSPVMAKYCGSKIPLPIVSTGSAMTIELTQPMTFYATYSVFDSHCGGTFYSIKGFFATPGYPDRYPSDMDCEWFITAAPGIKVSVTFKEFNIIESERCSTDFLEIRSGNSSGPEEGIYCGKNIPTNVTTDGTMWLLFKGSKPEQGATVTAKGFSGEYEYDTYNELTGSQGVIGSPLYPQPYTDGTDFSWKITVKQGKIILITFVDFYLVTSYTEDCDYFKVAFYDGDDDQAPLIKSVCGVDLPEPIKSTGNEMFIYFEHEMGLLGSKFLFKWLESDSKQEPKKFDPSTVPGCGSTEVIDIKENGGFYNLISPGFPHGYAPNINCEWVFSTISMYHLIADIRVMNLRDYGVRSFPLCSADYVNFYQKGLKDNDWQLVKRVCTKEDKSLEFTNLLKVQFSTNAFMNGTGFNITISQRCGASMEGPSGYIHFYRSSDPQCHNAQWNVTVRPGRTIKVIFQELNIPSNPDKTCDYYLLLQNGKLPDSPILGKYCGTENPMTVNTTGNYLQVKCEGLYAFQSFLLKYEEISPECGGEIELSHYDNSTEITSPNYPNVPLPHTECSWLIKGPPGESLRIDFEERFDLTYNSDCATDYVEVRDGGTKYSPLIGRYCDKIPSSQLSTDNMMFVKFFTDTDIPRNGFKAKISLAFCGGTLRGTKIQINNPSDTSQDETRNCTWRVVGPTGHYFNIEFSKFKLDWLNHRPLSRIIINEVRDLGQVSELGDYNGFRNPQKLTSSSNEVIVNYVGISNDKFILKFNSSETVCGQSLNSESGNLRSPGYPSPNGAAKYCRWTITVPEGRRITLTFSDIDFDTHDWVAVYDGSSRYKVVSVHLRRNSTRRIVESSSNRMTVTFWTTSRRRGFTAYYNSNKPTICSGDFNASSGILTQPSDRNNSYSCYWKHNSNNAFANQTLALSITLNGNITRRFQQINCRFADWAVAVTDRDEKNVLSSLCLNSAENRILSPFVIIQVYAFSKTFAQMNFTIKYDTYKCGGIIKEQQKGFISSLNYPDAPPEPLECAWLLEVDEKQIINVTMIGMDLGNDCDKSFLVVYNGGGPSHPKIGKYCKNNKPDFIVSQGKSLWIEFRYDRGATGKGFNLTYEAISEGCGGVYHDKERIIQTPNYDRDYPNNAECLWEIRSEPGYSIKLNFIDRFHIEDTVNCSKDFLEVWDWQGNDWVFLVKVCGRSAPDIKSSGDRLKLLFRSDNKTTARGFKAEWDWVCGGSLEATKTPQTLLSPGYPRAYSGDLNCVYDIITKARALVISFDDFDLEEGRFDGDCRYDNVSIKAKFYSTYFAPAKIHCGTDKPTLFRTHGNTSIIFKTDKYVNRRGFKLTIQDESCGGNINGDALIKGPTVGAHARYNQPAIFCLWNITAPPKQVVFLRILYLQMSPFCYGSSVQVFNGLSKDRDNKLGTLCGNVTENIVIHADSGNMLIQLDSNTYEYKGFIGQVYFSHGSAEGCGGTIDLNETVHIQAPDLDKLDCIWLIAAPSDYQIQIKVNQLNLAGSCDEDSNDTICSSVEIRDGGGPVSEKIVKLDSSWNAKTDKRQFTTSWNMGYIRFTQANRSSNAFKATLTPVLSICGPSVLNITDRQIRTLTSPNFPNNYPPGIKCTWLLTTDSYLNKIELHFANLSLTESGDDECKGDRVQIIEDPHMEIHMKGLGPQARYGPRRRVVFMRYTDQVGQKTFCGAEDFPFDVYGTGQKVMLTFQSSSTSRGAKGFKLEYGLVGCNRNYTSLQGNIFNKFQASNCTITITVPENRTISLYFDRLQTTTCDAAGTEIRDGGPNGTLLLKECGYRIPNPVFSYTNKLHIFSYVKQTSYTHTHNMYDIGYTSTDKGRGCGGLLKTFRGWVTSPLYPNQFKNDTVCDFAIRVPAGLHAVVKITDFNIVGDCDETYLKITTYSENRPVVLTLCQNDKSDIVRSQNSKIDIQYKSSEQNTGGGWRILFRGLDDDVADVR